MDLRVTTSRVGETVVVTLDGTADLATVPRLDRELRAVVASHAGHVVTIDVDALAAIDDVALGIVMGAVGTARAAGGDLVVVCSDPTRRKRLDDMGFTRAVTVTSAISERSDATSSHRSGHAMTAVIFTSKRTDIDADAYAQAAARMEELARKQPGFVGIDSVRGTDAVGITVSYWRTAEEALAWKRHPEHVPVQATGRSRWYEWYRVSVATVERGYEFTAPATRPADLPVHVFHLALPDDWAAAQTSPEYTISTRGVTLAQEGFIHCSFPEQVEGVANRFYGDLDELVVLRIATDHLTAEVRIEPAIEGGTEMFPHVYGPIPTHAVVEATPWHRGAGGIWHVPQI